MPIDPQRLVAKRRAIAKRRVQSATTLLAMLRELKAQKDESVGLTFVETDFIDQDRLNHVDVALYTQASTIVSAMLAAFVSNDWDDTFTALIP